MEYKDFLKHTADVKGVSVGVLEDAMKKIAYHETGPRQRLDPSARQLPTGPGRGLFMFEIGANMGAAVAVRRTYQYLKRKGLSVPSWLEELNPLKIGSIDVAGMLTEEEQKYIFLGNYLQHPKANLAQLGGGDSAVANFWLNYHWAGPSKLRNKRLKSFYASLNDMQGKKVAIKESKRQLRIIIR